MNKYTMIFFVVLFAVILLVFSEWGTKERDKVVLSVDTSSYNFDEIQGKLDYLADRLSILVAQSEFRGKNQKVKVPGAGDPQDYPATPEEGYSSVRSGRRPQVMVVNPSSQQTIDYDMLNNLLDDPAYVSTLSLERFAETKELRSLPRPMQDALIQKALDQYNNGAVSPEIFLGKNSPVYR